MFQIPFSKGVLLYRASRDGFTPEVFHRNCDGKKNTVTIITSNVEDGYVFGGFTSAKWESADRGTYATDANGFIFSLRRNGVSNNEKFMVGMDFGSSYELPKGYKHGDDKTRSYLAGSYEDWKPTEVEVFEIF